MVKGNHHKFETQQKKLNKLKRKAITCEFHRNLLSERFQRNLNSELRFAVDFSDVQATTGTRHGRRIELRLNAENGVRDLLALVEHGDAVVARFVGKKSTTRPCMFGCRDNKCLFCEFRKENTQRNFFPHSMRELADLVRFLLVDFKASSCYYKAK